MPHHAKGGRHPIEVADLNATRGGVVFRGRALTQMPLKRLRIFADIMRHADLIGELLCAEPPSEPCCAAGGTLQMIQQRLFAAILGAVRQINLHDILFFPFSSLHYNFASSKSLLFLFFKAYFCYFFYFFKECKVSDFFR